MKSNKTTIICVALFVIGTVIASAYTGRIVPNFMETMGYSYPSKELELLILLYSVPYIIGGAIIGLVDKLFSNHFAKKLLFVFLFSFSQAFLPLIGHFMFHHVHSEILISLVVSSIGAGVVSVSIVCLMKRLMKRA